MVDADLIDSEVGDEGEAIGGIEINGVGVRLSLPFWVRSRTRMLNQTRNRADFPFRAHRKDDRIGVTIAGGKNISARVVNRDVAKFRSWGELPIDERKLSRFRFDGKRRSAPDGFSARQMCLID